MTQKEKKRTKAFRLQFRRTSSAPWIPAFAGIQGDSGRGAVSGAGDPVHQYRAGILSGYERYSIHDQQLREAEGGDPTGEESLLPGSDCGPRCSWPWQRPCCPWTTSRKAFEIRRQNSDVETGYEYFRRSLEHALTSFGKDPLPWNPEEIPQDVSEEARNVVDYTASAIAYKMYLNLYFDAIKEPGTSK